MARNEHKKVLQQLSEAYQKVIKEETDDDPWGHDDDSDAALWRKQARARMKDPPISDERWKELKKQKPVPKGRLTMPGDKDRDDTFTLKDMQRDIMNGLTAKESMEMMGIHPANQKNLLAKYMEFSKDFSEGPIETGFEDENTEATSASFGRKNKKGYDGPWVNPRRERPDSGAGAEEFDRREHKPDALVSAQKAASRSRETLGDPNRRHFGFQPVHKPYISSFVDDDGNNIVAAIGSDGKIVHEVINGKSVPKKWPVRASKEAYAWLAANFEEI